MTDKTEIKKIAELSKLNITDAQIASMSSEIENMLKFASNLSNFKLSQDNINPMDIEKIREDISYDSFSQSDSLSSSPFAASGYFTVGKEDA